MTRKLLPYEYQLIDALGINEEEYLDFVAAQPIYEDIKEGTALDIRNGLAEVAIALTIVGTLAQVASVLLAPKPRAPQQAEQRGITPSRDDRVMPRFGFNGTQDLATYGTTIPLIYTNSNTNPNGGVRVNTALLWSAISSIGGNQFMRLLLSLGAGTIADIDPSRIALGQLPVRDYADGNIWIYWGSGRINNDCPKFQDQIYGGQSADPARSGTRNYYAAVGLGPFRRGNPRYGFSQVFSPTTSNTCTVGGVVPLNVRMRLLDERGGRGVYDIDTRLETGYRNGQYYRKGDVIRLIIPPNTDVISGNDHIARVRQRIQKVRYAEAPRVFSGARFKLGSAVFKASNIEGYSLDEGALFANLICEEDGFAPRVFYDVKYWTDAPYNTLKQLFYTKCLAQIEEAYYATTTKCDAVEFALRLTAYRKLSGRASAYGTRQRNYGDSESDNGGVMRTSMFALYWRLAGTPQWTKVRYIFAFRNSTEQTMFTFLKFIFGSDASVSAPGTPSFWEFKMVPITDPSVEPNMSSEYCYLIPNGPLQTIRSTAGNSHASIQFSGAIYRGTLNGLPPLNRVPGWSTSPINEINEWDLWNYDDVSDSQFSFEQGPELTITAVNEQLLRRWSNYGDLYRGMSLLALNAFASNAIRDLRSVSVWVKKGKMVRLLSTNRNDYASTAQINALAAISFPPFAPGANPNSPSVNFDSSNYASEVFLDTVLDAENGIGEYASIHSVDVAQLAESKLFCVVNGLFLDGVIADQRSWREFWAQTAPLSLLELARIGGRDTLIPGVPYNPATGYILNNQALPISALFTAGNILEDSYKEEFIDYGSNTQDAVVSVIFRDTERDGTFSRNSTVQVRLSDVRLNSALYETIDASGFVTRREQAILIGKFLCLSKRYFRRSIEFKTFPTDSPIAPGSYIYVEIGLNKWNSIYSGRIEQGGKLNAPLPQQVPNGTYTAFVYSAGQATRQVANIVVNNGEATALAAYENALFVLGTAIKNKRVFRVTEVELNEEGETTVRATEHPTDGDGISLIAKKFFEQGAFNIDG